MRLSDNRYVLQLPQETGCPVSAWIAAIMSVPTVEQSVHLLRFDVLQDRRCGLVAALACGDTYT
jgi:hypothetical protein